jgi:hypothetical protein
MQGSHRIIDRLASSPVRYSCRCPHHFPDSKSSILQKCYSNPPRHTPGRLALLLVRQHTCPLRTQHFLTPVSIQPSAICIVTLTLTVMVVSSNQSVRYTTAQYAPLSLFTSTTNRRTVLCAHHNQTRTMVRQIPIPGPSIDSSCLFTRPTASRSQ